MHGVFSSSPIVIASGILNASESMRKPLIFVPDTCVLLDIVRAPVRREFSQDNSRALLTILEWVRTGGAALQLVIPSIVRDEFEQNITTVVRDASQELERIFETHAHADTTLGLLLSRKIQPPREGAAQLIDRCRDLASELLDLARQAATIDVDLTKAANRSMRGHAPAKRGKSSLGDCVITGAQRGWQRSCRRIDGEDAGPHVQTIERRADRLRIVQQVVSRQFPVEQVEFETHDSRHRFETIANQSFLGGTAQLLDAIAHPSRVFRRRNLRPR